MKIYEFSYTDNLNQSESQVLETVAHFLEDESVLQSWAPDYSHHQCQKVEQLSTGERRYHFEVNGQFSDKDGDEMNNYQPGSSSPAPDIAAASGSSVDL